MRAPGRPRLQQADSVAHTTPVARPLASESSERAPPRPQPQLSYYYEENPMRPSKRHLLPIPFPVSAKRGKRRQRPHHPQTERGTRTSTSAPAPLAGMAMDDEDDVWAITTSPSASPPTTTATAGGFISTALSLNSRLHLLGCGSPFHSGSGGSGGVASGYRNAAASSSSSFFSAAASFPHLAPLDASPARRALEREMCLGGGATTAAWAGAGGGGGATDRRKKRMIKNRESASRSRARKQAYVTQLESEVQHLQQENEKLRVKYEQLKESVEVPVPVKRTLQRVLSAPF